MIDVSFMLTPILLQFFLSVNSQASVRQHQYRDIRNREREKQENGILPAVIFPRLFFSCHLSCSSTYPIFPFFHFISQPTQLTLIDQETASTIRELSFTLTDSAQDEASHSPHLLPSHAFHREAHENLILRLPQRQCHLTRDLLRRI